MKQKRQQSIPSHVAEPLVFTHIKPGSHSKSPDAHSLISKRSKLLFWKLGQKCKQNIQTINKNKLCVEYQGTRKIHLKICNSIHSDIYQYFDICQYLIENVRGTGAKRGERREKREERKEKKGGERREEGREKRQREERGKREKCTRTNKGALQISANCIILTFTQFTLIYI